MSLCLSNRCALCNKNNNLSRCAACKVVHYCSRDHQVEHRAAHKDACIGIKKAQRSLDEEDSKLRNDAELAAEWDFSPGSTIFEEQAGHFWGILETRDYMRSRFGLVEALLKANTLDAVQSAYVLVMETLRLCRSDNMGVRDQVPAICLRLGKDQECYDFIKWWATTGKESDYDWGNMDLPYLNIKDGDVFEPVNLFIKKFPDLSHIVAITLLKIRLLLDLKALQNSITLREKVPQEILDEINQNLVSTIILKDKGIMQSKDQTNHIRKLESHIRKLYETVENENRYFWPALLQPGKNIDARPDFYSRGSVEAMQLALRYSYDSWVETPGALDVIKELRK